MKNRRTIKFVLQYNIEGIATKRTIIFAEL